MTETKLKNPKKEEFNFYDIFIKYGMHWPWFVACILLSLTLTTIWLRYQTPVYDIRAAVLIKEQDQTQNRSSNPLTAIQDMGIMSKPPIDLSLSFLYFTISSLFYDCFIAVLS